VRAITPTESARPFLKWLGGKRWLAPRMEEYLPESYGRYYEPFLGGASVFFQLRPKKASLSDRNAELIETYRQLKDDVDGLIAKLRRCIPGKSEFLRLRSSRPRSRIGIATRFIYLNRTAFNGVYRVNGKGEFNTPFGCRPTTAVCEEEVLRAAAAALAGCTICVRDFEVAINRAREGDLIYADPPYTSKHDNNGFRRYNEAIFSWQDQERLAAAALKAAGRGVHVIVSNAHHDEIAALYKGFSCHTLTRTSCVSGRGHGRGRVREYLFTSV